jgi:hypothetical protein
MYGTVKYGNKTRIYSLVQFFQLVLSRTRGLVKTRKYFNKILK